MNTEHLCSFHYFKWTISISEAVFRDMRKEQQMSEPLLCRFSFSLTPIFIILPSEVNTQRGDRRSLISYVTASLMSGHIPAGLKGLHGSKNQDKLETANEPQKAREMKSHYVGNWAEFSF